MNLNRFSLLLTLDLLWVAGCSSLSPSTPPPTPGLIAADGGGSSGYQHDVDKSRFALGVEKTRADQYGYFKRVGSVGTLAVRRSNGSAFGVPDAMSPAARLPPYGKSPQDHDAYVRSYFLSLGLPADQIANVRGMTLLEASGRSDETERSIPKVTAYYSVIERRVGRWSVPDSFAWARANADGSVAQEGIYWPPLQATVLAEAASFERLLADPERRRAFETKLPPGVAPGALVVHHASATEDTFTAFASFDVLVRVPTSLGRVNGAEVGPSSKGAVVVRHFDMNGVERFLPQEQLNLGGKYTAERRQ